MTTVWTCGADHCVAGLGNLGVINTGWVSGCKIGAVAVSPDTSKGPSFVTAPAARLGETVAVEAVGPVVASGYAMSLPSKGWGGKGAVMLIGVPSVTELTRPPFASAAPGAAPGSSCWTGTVSASVVSVSTLVLTARYLEFSETAPVIVSVGSTAS